MTPPRTPAPDDETGVLSGLSRTRPQRRSTKRATRPAAATAEPAATASPETPPKPARKAATTAKGAARGAKTGTAKARPAAKKRTPAAAKATAAPATAAATPAPKSAPRRLEPVMAPPEKPSVRTEPPASPEGGISGVELVAQAIAAAGEVAQLGVGITRQVAKGVLSRLPRP